MDDCDDCNLCPQDGHDSRRNCRCCGLAAFMIFIILFAMSWDTLEPTEYGLVQNGFTGYVDLRPEAVYAPQLAQLEKSLAAADHQGQRVVEPREQLHHAVHKDKRVVVAHDPPARRGPATRQDPPGGVLGVTLRDRKGSE